MSIVKQAPTPVPTSEAAAPYWTDCLDINPAPRKTKDSRHILVGAIPGEGIGPEVIDCALEVLNAVADASDLTFEIQYGGAIGRDAERLSGVALTESVIEYCHGIFDSGGAILCGPGGGRFVYETRNVFELFFKISPLRSINGVSDACRLKPEWVQNLDILVTRENCGGIYQGIVHEDEDGCHHSFSYSHHQVRRFLHATARLAKHRSGHVTVVWKESGVAGISQLWKRCMNEAAEMEGVTWSMVDIDLMCYRLMSEPAAFDVIATPNLFGDVIGDLGAVLLGSRGSSFSGNYSEGGSRAIYQTNHGAAYDLVGMNVASPAGQIFSMAMMLRETFGLTAEANAVEQAVQNVWQRGYRTADTATLESLVVGTRELSSLIAQEAKDLVLAASSMSASN